MSTKQVFKKLLFVSLIAALAGCTGGGGGSVTGTASSSGGNGTLTTTQVFPSSQGSGWTPIVSAGRTYIKGLDLSINGACSRGIATIQVKDIPNAITYPTQATCSAASLYTWNNTFLVGDQGDKTLTLIGLDINSNPIAGATTTVNVRIDNIAPPAPVVTDPGSSPYQYSGAVASYLIQGTVSADTVTMTGPGGVTITPDAGHNWSYTAALIQSASLDFTFLGFDLAGNVSAGTTQTIVWAPSSSIRIGGPFQGGPSTDGVTNYSIESSGFIDNGFSSDIPSSYTLLTGFNFITNQVRADPN